MQRAPHFWGPRAYSLFGPRAPRLPEFFCYMFQCEIQTVRQGGALKSPNPPENARGPKYKKRVPIMLGPNVFCSLFQRGGPKSPRSSENIRTQKFTKVTNSRARNDFLFFCFSAGSKQLGAPKSPRPLKAKPPNKNTRGPKV
jgi:hypothetical protein